MAYNKKELKKSYIYIINLYKLRIQICLGYESVNLPSGSLLYKYIHIFIPYTTSRHSYLFWLICSYLVILSYIKQLKLPLWSQMSLREELLRLIEIYLPISNKQWETNRPLHWCCISSLEKALMWVRRDLGIDTTGDFLMLINR